MTGKQRRNLVFQHAERALVIDATHITLCAIHRFNHGENERSIGSEVERTAPALGLQRRDDRRLVENVGKGSIVGAFHLACFNVECSGTAMFQPVAEMCRGILEHMGKRFQIVARKARCTQQILGRTSVLRFCPNVVILRRLLGRRACHGFLLDHVDGRAIIGRDGLAAILHGDLRQEPFI